MEYMTFQGPGFQLEVPTDWLITSSPDYQVMFKSQITRESSFHPTVIVIIRPVEADKKLSMVAEEIRTWYASEYAEFEVVSSVDYTEKGGLAYLHTFTWLYEENKTRIRQIQCLYRIADALFLLTATRTENDPSWDEVLTHIIESFQFTIPAEPTVEDKSV
jgi:hypothetical protein